MAPLEKKAWAAGIIDGEGYIHREKNSKNSTRAYVQVQNTDLSMLIELVKYFNGSIHIVRRKNRPNSKLCWRWLLTCQKAERFLENILPFLITKKELAEQILQNN